MPAIIAATPLAEKQHGAVEFPGPFISRGDEKMTHDLRVEDNSDPMCAKRTPWLLKKLALARTLRLNNYRPARSGRILSSPPPSPPGVDGIMVMVFRNDPPGYSTFIEDRFNGPCIYSTSKQIVCHGDFEVYIETAIANSGIKISLVTELVSSGENLNPE